MCIRDSTFPYQQQVQEEMAAQKTEKQEPQKQENMEQQKEQQESPQQTQGRQDVYKRQPQKSSFLREVHKKL